MSSMHPEEVEERKAAFQKLWREKFLDRVRLIRPCYQGEVHDLLKRAFYDGSNYERRKNEPMRVGGMD